MSAAVLAPIAALWLLPAAAEAGALLRARRGSHPAVPAPPSRLRLLVLVPAHDEEALIGDCLASMAALRCERSDVTVVVLPDGCSDRTAAIARAAQVSVMEHEGAALGKGRVLRWAIATLDLAPYDVVAIVDADSMVAPGFADALADAGPLRDKAAQGYIALANPDDSWLTELAELLQAVRYDGQYRVRSAASLNVPLNGTAMCFGVDLLHDVGLPIETQKEDLELYARYTALGRRIVYVPSARVLTQEPRSLGQASVQRERWQAGKTLIARRCIPPLLGARIPIAQKLDALAELLPVGPVAHAAIAVVLAFAALLLGGALAAAVVTSFALSIAPMVLGTLAALVKHPRRTTLLRALLALPLYAVWRTTLLLRGLVRGAPAVWRRTPRHAPSAAR